MVLGIVVFLLACIKNVKIYMGFEKTSWRSLDEVVSDHGRSYDSKHSSTKLSTAAVGIDGLTAQMRHKCGHPKSSPSTVSEMRPVTYGGWQHDFTHLAIGELS